MHLLLFKRTVTTSFGLVRYQKTFGFNRTENDKPNQNLQAFLTTELFSPKEANFTFFSNFEIFKT